MRYTLVKIFHIEDVESLHLLEITWRPLKNLLKCGLRRDLVRFSQGNGCTDFYYFSHCSTVYGARDAYIYGNLTTFIRVLEKMVVSHNLLYRVVWTYIQYFRLVFIGKQELWKLLFCSVSSHEGYSLHENCHSVWNENGGQ